MTDLKFKILEELYKTTRRELDHTEIYNLNLAPAIEVKKAIGDLISDELMKYIHASTILHLTKAGIKVYEQTAQEHKREIQAEKEKKLERKIKIVQSIVSIFSTLTTFATNHLDYIWSFLHSFFK